ncbi:helix-turn-helix domain-containing protein [Labilibacter sediminis]|nr:helix-turn-helix domain-containing protein [Labilibacter sediminis]
MKITNSRKGVWVLWLFLTSFQLTYSNSIDIRFEHIGLKEGLPTNSVLSFAQDHDGFMWVGTSNGLFRYDGYTFEQPFYTNNIGLGIESAISALIVDKNNSLWAATNNGLLLIDLNTYKTKAYVNKPNNNNSLCSNEVRALFINKNDQVWIGTKNGLSVFNPGDQSFKNYYHQPNVETSLSHNIVRAIAEDSKGNIWVGTYDGLNIFSPVTESFTKLKLTNKLDNQAPNDLVLDLKTYSILPNHIFAGTNKGLFKIDISSKEFQTFYVTKDKYKSPSNNTIKSIGPYINGKIPLGTDFGFNLFSPFERTFEHFFYQPNNIRSISNNVIKCTYIDASGTMWIGTNNGINIFDINKAQFSFNRINNTNLDFTDYDIACFAESDKNIWFGSGNGIAFVNKKTGKFNSYPTDSKTNDLHIDREGSLWAATVQGVFKINEKRNTFDIFSENTSKLGLSTNFTNTVIETEDNSIWIGTSGHGINRIFRSRSINGELKEDSVAHYSNHSGFSIPSDKIQTLLEDQNYLWVSTNGNGVFRININTNEYEVYTVKTTKGNLLSNTCYDIIKLPNKSLLFCTSKGICLFEKGHFREIIIPGISNSKVINGILTPEGSLWLSDYTKLYRFANYSHDTYQSFEIERTLPIGVFNKRSSLLTENGQLLFGAINGVISFYPQQFTSNNFIAPIQISSIEVNNEMILPGKDLNNQKTISKPIHFEDLIHLKESDRNIVINFASMHFSGLYENNYSYKLEGFDTEWNYTTGDKNYARYSNLRKGNYTFILKATNNDDIWMPDEKIIKFKVAPYWYASPLAFVLYAILIFSFTYMGIKLIIADKEKSHIKLINKIKLQFFTNISHEFKTPLTLILLPLENILRTKPIHPEEYIESVNIAHKNAIKLKNLIDQLMLFRKIDAGKMRLAVNQYNFVDFAQSIFKTFEFSFKDKELDTRLITSETKIQLWFDQQKMEMLLNNLLSNALKFTQRHGSIKLSIEEKAKYIIVSVSDSGKGISKENQKHIFERFYQDDHNRNQSGTGIGLNLVKDIAELHHGSVAVESEAGKGSCFKVKLLKGKSHFDSNTDFAFTSTEKNEYPEIDIVHNTSSQNINDGDSVEGQKEKNTILIAEDNDEIRKYIIKHLHPFYNFIEAADGKEALKKVKDTEVSLIISDLMMPIMGGNEFCQIVKEDVLYSHIPFIMLTAKSSIDQKIQGLSEGADAYITKPFDFTHLKVTIDNLIVNREKLKKKYSENLIIGPNEIKIESLDEKFLRSTLAIIEENIANFDLSVDNLASELKISSKQLYRKIKALTDQTPIELIKEMRLKRAKQYLDKNGANISEIAYSCGFATPAYFTKCFKEKYNCTPTEYKKNRS